MVTTELTNRSIYNVSHFTYVSYFQVFVSRIIFAVSPFLLANSSLIITSFPLKHSRHSEKCMCRLRNIAMRDYQESVTTGQTHTDGRRTK